MSGYEFNGNNDTRLYHYGDYLVKDTRHSKPKVTDCEDDQIITVEYYDDDQITVEYSDQNTVEYCDDDRLTIDYTDDHESRTYVHDHPYYNCGENIPIY